jgi:hypothetical protein
MTKIRHEEYKSINLNDEEIPYFITEMDREGFRFELYNYRILTIIKTSEKFAGGRGICFGFAPLEKLMPMIDELSKSANEIVKIENGIGETIDFPKKLLPDLSVFLRTFLLCDIKTPASRLREIYENLTT